MRSKDYDVIVIGGGHSGIEAALSASRVGANTLLLTDNIDTIGQMSCNPAIGGIGKSHLVKEIDALDGVIGKIANYSGIHRRILNERKGPAVRATRIQCDRMRYRQYSRFFLEQAPNLSIFQQKVCDLTINEQKIVSVTTEHGMSFSAKSFIFTVGTFLDGKIYIGLSDYSGGRLGEKSSSELAKKFRELGFKTNRLKTGTPPRIDAKSLDFSKMEIQPSHDKEVSLSFMSDDEFDQKHLSLETVDCYIGHTNTDTHNIIREALEYSPIYSGMIGGIGPRYCPSIEDKIVRFSDKESHQIFFEPEGLFTQEVYPNGISSSLPFDIQVKFLQTIEGAEKAHITRPGYAIEYDFFDPRGLHPTLQTKEIENLFFAGQINGTTGYEEAAAQGLVAGINAARLADEKSLWVPSRTTSYIGVMIDDLTNLGTQEPYRMFTSRAEFRLSLREDNADFRLTEIGQDFGVVSNQRFEYFSQKKNSVNQILDILKHTKVSPDTWQSSFLEDSLNFAVKRDVSLFDLFKRPECNFELIENILPESIQKLPKEFTQQAILTIKYSGYLSRQKKEVERLEKYKNIKIPDDFDFSKVNGLSLEVQQKLKEFKPTTLSIASKISGITPSALSLILVYLQKYKASVKIVAYES